VTVSCIVSCTRKWIKITKWRKNKCPIVVSTIEMIQKMKMLNKISEQLKSSVFMCLRPVSARSVSAPISVVSQGNSCISCIQVTTSSLETSLLQLFQSTTHYLQLVGNFGYQVFVRIIYKYYSKLCLSYPHTLSWLITFAFTDSNFFKPGW